MKNEDLISAAKQLQDILKYKPPINLGLPKEELTNAVKKAALWLWADDNISPVTVSVLKEIEWSDDDFLDYEDPKRQDPLPAFYRYGIIPDPADEEPRKRTPRIKVQTTKEIKKENDPIREHLEKAPPPRDAVKPPSAYGTALALMGPDPNLNLPELYDMMEEQGFDKQVNSGSIKTAHSIFRKCYRYLKANGHIKE